ncbi:MAG: methyltransferase, partial [Bacilli bacterium]|nr:methyltransferase [Bacilli bacterium]
VNPPIRAGKKVTYAMYEGAKQYLIDGGSLYIVIRKAQGADSASKYIESIFGNIKLLDRHKGYHIYQAIKSKI